MCEEWEGVGGSSVMRITNISPHHNNIIDTNYKVEVGEPDHIGQR